MRAFGTKCPVRFHVKNRAKALFERRKVDELTASVPSAPEYRFIAKQEDAGGVGTRVLQPARLRQRLRQRQRGRWEGDLVVLAGRAEHREALRRPNHGKHVTGL